MTLKKIIQILKYNKEHNNLKLNYKFYQNKSNNTDTKLLHFVIVITFNVFLKIIKIYIFGNFQFKHDIKYILVILIFIKWYTFYHFIDLKVKNFILCSIKKMNNLQ